MGMSQPACVQGCGGRDGQEHLGHEIAPVPMVYCWGSHVTDQEPDPEPRLCACVCGQQTPTWGQCSQAS